eukprot:scaffold3700_cov387-Prasinococcus_capsulatus_cf.AAC.13
MEAVTVMNRGRDCESAASTVAASPHTTTTSVPLSTLIRSEGRGRKGLFILSISTSETCV